MKMLYILNIANRVNSFSNASMRAAKDLGIEFQIAGNWGYQSDEERKADEVKYDIRIHQINFYRSPCHPGNYKAYKQLLDLVNKEKFDVIHCNTPIGGLLGRLVGKKCKTTYVIYQAHGFHFYKGAPLINWLIYYPIERWLAHYTDMLITINQEDYLRAKKSMTLRNHGDVVCVPGVGIDLSQFNNVDDIRSDLLRDIIADQEIVLLICIGELNQNKNFKTIIRAVAKTNSDKMHLIICGDGPLETKLRKLATQLNINEQVHFLGYRTDVLRLLKTSDVYITSSLREGLSRSLMEAMASGLPCIASKIRGNVDLIEDGIGGYLHQPKDVNAFASSMTKLGKEAKIRKSMGAQSRDTISKYEVGAVIKEMLHLYTDIISDESERFHENTSFIEE